MHQVIRSTKTSRLTKGSNFFSPGESPSESPPSASAFSVDFLKATANLSDRAFLEGKVDHRDFDISEAPPFTPWP
ncbi:hypothetical protein BDN67DRAFT_975720 [Paxillus ammoniavirescens]|nr:hypothetical protein BDN67DRAFT_975720 [Paxillus ammoniavirescens]